MHAMKTNISFLSHNYSCMRVLFPKTYEEPWLPLLLYVPTFSEPDTLSILYDNRRISLRPCPLCREACGALRAPI